jgi:chromosome segregation ATPase
MRAQICLVLLSILGFAFSQNFLANNQQVIGTIMSTFGQMGSEFNEGISQVASEIAAGQYDQINATMANMSSQVQATAQQLDSLSNNTEFMQQVQSLAQQIEQQVQQLSPSLVADEALVPVVKSLGEHLMNDTKQNAQLIASLEQIKSNITKGLTNNTDLLTGSAQLFTQFTNDLVTLGNQILAGADASTTLQTLLNGLKANASSNAALNNGLEELAGSVSAALENNTALFSALQTLSSNVSSDLSTFANQTNNTDAISIATSVQQGVAEFNTAFGTLATGNTNTTGVLSQAGQKAYQDVASNPIAVQAASQIKGNITTITDEIEGDLGVNTTPAPLGAERMMLTFTMVLAVLAFFL